MNFLHTMIRVSNLDRAVKFYTDMLGMKELRRTENKAYRYTLVFVGYAENPEQAEIELTYNWDQSEYELGNSFGHLAIGVNDIYKTCEDIRAKGGIISREPGPVKGGTTEIAFIKDPDGYPIELIQQ